jgi:hypothetical protein
MCHTTGRLERRVRLILRRPQGQLDSTLFWRMFNPILKTVGLVRYSAIPALRVALWEAKDEYETGVHEPRLAAHGRHNQLRPARRHKPMQPEVCKARIWFRITIDGEKGEDVIGPYGDATHASTPGYPSASCATERSCNCDCRTLNRRRISAYTTLILYTSCTLDSDNQARDDTHTVSAISPRRGPNLSRTLQPPANLQR